MAYAIIRAGGHQEKVSPGEIITVDKVKNEPGEQINFSPMAVSTTEGELTSDKAVLEGASVVAKVVQHIKSDKVESFQYRHKTGYRKHTGHRQPMTVLEVLEIQVGGQTFGPPEPVAEPEPTASDADAGEKAAPKKKAPAKKPAAKKAPASKKAATKK
jgi:large subunit ribosomal protein L21